MNGKQSKKIRRIAQMIHSAIPKSADGLMVKSADKIYHELKKVHINKIHHGNQKK